MATWTTGELEAIGAADELAIRSMRRDGSLRNPVTIWVVRVGDDLYVRAAAGRTSRWFRSVVERHEGRISAGGVEKDVALVEVDGAGNDAIDAEYRRKYAGYERQYVDPMVAPDARGATLRLVPSS